MSEADPDYYDHARLELLDLFPRAAAKARWPGVETIVDPWGFLQRLRAVLDPGATVVASIPNVANLWLLDELAAGRFTYAGSGLLDKTHLRFFTRGSIAALFGGAGYDIRRWERVTDGRVDDATRRRIFGVMLPVPLGGHVAGKRVDVRGVDAAAYQDLRTYVFFVVAQPRTGKTDHFLKVTQDE